MVVSLTIKFYEILVTGFNQIFKLRFTWQVRNCNLYFRSHCLFGLSRRILFGAVRLFSGGLGHVGL